MKHLLTLMVLTAIMISPTAAQEATPLRVQGVDFVANYYAPTKSDTGQVTDKKYGVIMLTGSAGGFVSSEAKKFAALGHPVLSLAYFFRKKGKNLPADAGKIAHALEDIPLEYFDAPKKWLMARSETKMNGVIVIGYSKGAELALVLAAHDPDYKAVIAVAPSSVVWSGIAAEGPITQSSSSWSLDGKPLPFIPYISREVFRHSDLGLYSMTNWHIASIASMTDAQALRDATIKVAKITVPLLLLSGGKDLAWPSNEMAMSICKKINAVQNNPTCHHINYPDAPHMLGDPTPDADREMSDFLKSVNQ